MHWWWSSLAQQSHGLDSCQGPCAPIDYPVQIDQCNFLDILHACLLEINISPACQQTRLKLFFSPPTWLTRPCYQHPAMTEVDSSDHSKRHPLRAPADAMALGNFCDGSHSGMTLSRPQQGISIKLDQQFDSEDNDILSTIKWCVLIYILCMSIHIYHTYINVCV